MEKRSLKFPDGFYWGAASASYQVEGSIYNNDWAKAGEAGKVPKADNRIDHYNKYEEDFSLAKDLGHNCSRLSIEWSRIEPAEGHFDQSEIDHYRKVLEYMRSIGLKPFVTFWHFTQPTWFSDMGGFENKKSVYIFTRYCMRVLDDLNDVCDNWATINEPNVWASNGYQRGNWPPFKKNPFKYFKVLRNLVKAHKSVFIKSQIKYGDRIDVGIVKDNIQFTSDKNLFNILIAKVADSHWNHYFLNKVRNHTDFIGLNYYFHQHFGKGKEYPKSDMGWNIDPEGIYHVLMDLKRYQKPVYITEAGIADKEDKYRAEYIKGMVKWTYKAIEEGVMVKGFMYWSLLDNFEWALGYDKEFGLIHIDPVTKERIVRSSAYVYKDICVSNTLTIK